ncbi:MAG: MFS family permease, partial [Candidatus Promineifilaceae bacterium]
MWHITPRKLFIFIFLSALFGFSLRVAHDPDLFWHLKTGEYILENGIPHQDPSFSFTATDREWVTHEWLTQVLMTTIYKFLGGLNGLSIIFALLIALAFGLLFWASDGQPYLAGFSTFWGITASLPFLNARPQMFNLLFGAWIVLVAEQVRRGKWPTRLVWTFPLLFVLWVNMHGGFLLGFVILGVYVVGEGLQLFFSGEREEGLNWQQIQTFAFSGVVGFIASIINPNTYRMWLYAFETLTSDAMRDTILEWQSPNFHMWVFWFFGFMLMATFFVMIYSKRLVLWTDVLFIAGTTFASLQSVRNIPLFALVAIPILSRHLLGLFMNTPWYPLFSGLAPDPIPNRMMNRISWFAIVLVLIGMIAFSMEELGKTKETIGRKFPIAAVDWLESEGLSQARIFNEYEWGGYLIWRNVPTFIDGRADLFGDELIYFYMQTYTRQSSWREPLDKFDVEYLLIKSNGGLRTLI